MINQHTLEFLSKLRKNNNKDWFDAHKSDYKDAYQNFLDFTQAIIEGLAAFDEDIRHSHPDAKKCVMRIYRDVRFSKDKSPFKSNFFAYINKDGKKSPFGGYYFNLEPGASFFGGGIYMPENKVLAKIRESIDQYFDEWQKVTNNKSLTDCFGEIKPSGKLSRPPKGFDTDNPAIDWLKFKGFYTQKNLTDKELTEQDLLHETAMGYRAVKPLVDFINRSLDQN